jgi:hypothetical protein
MFNLKNLKYNLIFFYFQSPPNFLIISKSAVHLNGFIGLNTPLKIRLSLG